MNAEHAAFADATVGGIHKPGGCAVLGIEDGTATVIADGTVVGHGIIWDNTEALWCCTAAAGASTTGDWTILQMNPNTQWKGGDVTWAGEHQFDGSGYFTQPIEFSTVDLTGPLYVDSSADFSDVYSAGDVSILGNLSCNSDCDIAGDFSVDGTLVMQDAVLTGDSTFTFDPIAGETGPTFKILGDWSARSNNTTYTSRTDGMVITQDGVGATTTLATPSGTTRAQVTRQAGGYASGTMLVKKGNTWDVSGAGAVFWLPFGDNT